MRCPVFPLASTSTDTPALRTLVSGTAIFHPIWKWHPHKVDTFFSGHGISRLCPDAVKPYLLNIYKSTKLFCVHHHNALSSPQALRRCCNWGILHLSFYTILPQYYVINYKKMPIYFPDKHWSPFTTTDVCDYHSLIDNTHHLPATTTKNRAQ